VPVGVKVEGLEVQGSIQTGPLSGEITGWQPVQAKPAKK
jgi:hypothetical protein